MKGTLIQGNFIGDYPVYPVDAADDRASPAGSLQRRTHNGSNTGVGISVQAANTTIGGENPQESNVITTNGLEGILLDSAATGSIVSGNQIGLMSLGRGRYSSAATVTRAVSRLRRRPGARFKRPDRRR